MLPSKSLFLWDWLYLCRTRTRGSVLVSGRWMTCEPDWSKHLSLSIGNTSSSFRTSRYWMCRLWEAYGEKSLATLEVSLIYHDDDQKRLANTEALTLSQSTAGSIFWTLDQMNQIVSHLASIGMSSCLVTHSISMTKKQKVLRKMGLYMKPVSSSVVCELRKQNSPTDIPTNR
jgi:hypothetical protein